MKEWLIGGGILLIVGGGIFWYMIGWRNRMFRQPEKIAEPEPEPETAMEQTVIEPASGELLPAHAMRAIGGARWGRSVRRRYIPEEYDGPIACLRCARSMLPGQFFWETPLISRETGEDTGEAFQLCLSCQPGDIAAVIHRGA